MPRINLRRRTVPSIGELRHIVWICTTTERPDEWVSTIRERPGVFRCHARIRNMLPDQILDYRAVFGSQDAPTTEIIIRFPPDVKVDLNHWVYREDGPAKMWLKVRSVEDLGNAGRFLILRCSIDTVNDVRTDKVTQELPPTWEMPSVD
jgi:hypothetical protein